jgi:hypothetical protein
MFIAAAFFLNPSSGGAKYVSLLRSFGYIGAAASYKHCALTELRTGDASPFSRPRIRMAAFPQPDNGVGVSHRTVKIPKIDSDYFEE